MGYGEEILAAATDEEHFVRLTFSNAHRPAEVEWQKVVIRPVQLAAGRELQAVFQGKRKQVTRTVPGKELARELDTLLQMGFRRIHVQGTNGDLHVRITKKGKALVSRGKSSVPELPAVQPHDRTKTYPFPRNGPDPFLEQLGVMRKGRVLSTMQDKFRQINQFLLLLSNTRPFAGDDNQEVIIVDCGCGRAFLTLAAYHYLKEKRGILVRLVGVDADDGVLADARKLRDKLGYEDVTFVQSRIGEYKPECPPAVVLSLHACDTATDEAIAQGVNWGAELICCVPCCQHELHHNLPKRDFITVLRHGILRERLADIVTDALRAAALRVMGYKAEVIEFISPGHTAKNLMIRAERTRGMRVREAAREYLRLRDYWQVEPCIAKLLGSRFQQALLKAAPPR